MQETQEMWVWPLGQEHPLEEKMGSHSSILAGIIPWTEETDRLQFMGLQRIGHDWATELMHTHTHTTHTLFHCSTNYNSQENNTWDLADIRMQPLSMVSPKEAQDVKNRILAQDSWDAHERNGFSEPRLLYLPIYRKALYFLTWDIWFSLINNNLLMSRLPALCCKTSI